MSSTWSSKIQTKLSALADGASKESMQTLATWMGFNRKHASALCEGIFNAFQSTNSSVRKVLYLSVAHETLVAEHDNPKKWERLADLRTALGEAVLLPAAKARKEDEVEVLGVFQSNLREWDELNVFGIPTLLNQIKKALSAPKPVVTAAGTEEEAKATKEPQAPEPEKAADAPTEKKTKETDIASTETPKETASGEETTKMPASVPASEKMERGKSEEVKEDGAKTSKETQTAEKAQEEEKAKTTTLKRGLLRRESSKVLMEEIKKFDFEKEGIEFGKVDAKEVYNQIQTVASLQIARELRQDAALRISSILAAVPKEVVEACRRVRETGEPIEDLDKLPPLSDDVLDMNLEESANNIRMYREILMKQQESRQECIRLLIKSRCQFGSEEAAEAFYETKTKTGDLRKRKEILSDAMALEGLDFEETQEEVNLDDELPELTWYTKKNMGEGEPSNKKTKIET